MSDAFKGLRLTNTLTRTKEDFVPIDAGNVRMYVCGPTVYDFAHIGNARPVIVFDVLYRLLRQLYGETHVTYVRNITDVDDKINARALRDFPDLPLNEAIARVTEKTADQFHADVARLGCLEPTYEPRATEFVQPRADGKTDMVTLIQRLIERGHAYEANGEVLFDTASMPDYGALSKRNLDEQQAGARIAVEGHKKNPGDFVLWKLSSPEEPGWQSPWGRGRPGWHIECSAMGCTLLGEQFDIHGGGQDLQFPHHENEIAQSEAANGVTFARFWCHNGMVNLQGEKMSKSTKLYFLIEDIAKDFEPELVRFYLSSTHYRSPIEFGVDRLSEARTAWQRIRQPMERFGGFDEAPAEAPSAAMQSAIDEAETRFTEAMNDDANTARAIGYLFDLAREVNKAGESGDAAQAKAGAQALRKLGSWIGLFWTRLAEGEAEWPAEVLDLVARREAARKSRNFKEADELRDKLKALGVVVEDGAQGPRIKAGV
jgi:cysteinyl-tRNA synthetase